MLLDDTPLPSDAGALQNVLDDLVGVNSSWLTMNHILDLWLQSALQDPNTAVLVAESLFSLNKAETLQEYRIGVKICRMLIADSLLQKQTSTLNATVIADPDILSQEIFPLATINLTDLFDTSLIPPLLWNTHFDFVPPLPPKVTPPVATHMFHAGTERVEHIQIRITSMQKVENVISIGR